MGIGWRGFRWGFRWYGQAVAVAAAVVLLSAAGLPGGRAGRTAHPAGAPGIIASAASLHGAGHVTIYPGISSTGRMTAGPLGRPAPAVAAAAACPAWSAPADVGTTYNILLGVSVTTGCNAWAAGFETSNAASPGQALIEHWDGSAWSVQPSPVPGATSSRLFGVAAASAASAWAVGWFATGTTGGALTEHWDGTAWTQVPCPNPHGTAVFTGVSAPSASNAWAVGRYNIGGTFQTLIEHWDGTAWTQVSSPDIGSNSNFLTGVAATSASNAWAVGYYRSSNLSNATQTLILHWNGTAWSQVPSPNPGGPSVLNELLGVAATSASNAWAVGYYINGSGLRTLIEHWNGTAWTQVRSPSPGAPVNALAGVASSSATSAWAVGDYETSSLGPPLTLVEHWNGTRWVQVASPDPGAKSNSLLAVASHFSDTGAVGFYSNDGTTEQALAVRL